MMQVDIISLLTVLFAVLGYGLCCETDEFSCNNGQCIKKLLWCDEEIDCLDKSDEDFCREVYKSSYGIIKDPNRCSNYNHFYLCSDGKCIPNTGLCDGYPSCNDGSDEENCEKDSTSNKTKPAVYEHKATFQHLTEDYIDDSSYFSDLDYLSFETELSSARNWLLSQLDQNYGWGDYTPRAIVALALSKTGDFHHQAEKELLMNKQLGIQLSVALNRNCSKSLPLCELALYINALMATCSNPRNFHGFDLVTTLRERVDDILSKKSFVSPFVILTLCMNNMTNHNDIYALRRILTNQNYAENRIGTLSLASLAISCIVRTPTYAYPQYRRDLLKALLNKLDKIGLPENIYDASLVVQALNEARVDQREWKRDEAMHFILSKQDELGSFGDILATYNVIPILSGNSILSLATHCNKDFSKGLIPLEILKNTNRDRINISYSLFFGNPVEMSQNIEMQVPHGINFLDVMRLAQEENVNFKFKLDGNRNVPFVYSIGGIPNDAERGQYWSLFIQSQQNKSDLIPHSNDVRRYFPSEGEEAIFWLRETSL